MPRWTLLSIALLSAGCAVGPNYHRPELPSADKYKEAPSDTGKAATSDQWKPAQPADAQDRGKWWEVFGDSDLNALEEQLNVANQTIAQAEAQYRFARAGVRLARASLLPTLGVAPSATRSSGVTNRSSAPPGGAPPSVVAYSLPADLSWEIDLFGRIRRTVEANVALAQASAADLETVRLAIHAELAIDYLTLRGLDSETQLLDSTVAAYEDALRITTNRYKQGIVSGVDVAQAQAVLETTRAQVIDLRLARAQVEHAIAILLGKPPSAFTLPKAPRAIAPPFIPAELPSALLERRPDLAAAARRAAAANAQIGVAHAAYFPTLTLSATGGFAGATLANLFTLPNRFWSLGASLAETLFSGGRRRALSAQAVASYDASVAAYRESVLSAFQEVEDNLAAQRILAEEADQQAKAVAATDHLLALAKNRYQAGVTTYLEVITAQNAALADQRTAVQLTTRRMTASVSLLKALGGIWPASGPQATNPSPASAAPPAAADPPAAPAAPSAPARPAGPGGTATGS